MDTILLQSIIQTATHNFKAKDLTDYSAITYFSDSKSVLKLQGPSTTLYHNTNFGTPDFNYPGTLEKDINIPLISGVIPQGAYTLTATTRITKIAVPVLSVTLGTNSILVNTILDGNFVAGTVVTWTGGANAGTYTVASAVTGVFGVTVTFVGSLVSSSATGSIGFDEEIITIEDYTYCYSAPVTTETIFADCPTARLGVTNSTNYAITCEGQSVQPTSAVATLVLTSPTNEGGSPVYATATTLLPTGSTYYTTELWTQTWTGVLTTVLAYTLPSGLMIETTIVGSKSLDVTCDATLCCMSSCLQNATNTFLSAVGCTTDLNILLAATVKYLKIQGAFMMYSVGVNCGSTTLVATALANMQTYLADTNCCNDCQDNGQSIQIVAIYNVVVSGNTLIVQSGDVYIDISQAVVGDVTTATFTLDTIQVGNLINTYLTANPSVITNIIAANPVVFNIIPYATPFDTLIEFTGNTTIGSPIISNVTPISGIIATDIQEGNSLATATFADTAYILSIAPSGDITMSSNAVANGVGGTFNVGMLTLGIESYKFKRNIGGVITYGYQLNGFGAKSITEIQGGGFELVNDSGAPGNNKFYGTTSGGVKGYQDFPTVLAALFSTPFTSAFTSAFATAFPTAFNANFYTVSEYTAAVATVTAGTLYTVLTLSNLPAGTYLIIPSMRADMDTAADQQITCTINTTPSSWIMEDEILTPLRDSVNFAGIHIHVGAGVTSLTMKVTSSQNNGAVAGKATLVAIKIA